MTFISYSQNCEDVILWRALKHIDCGFYIDVGAQDPFLHSVTCAFYERGWHGINIEPVSQWFDKLSEQRPQDINLNIAVSDKAEKVALADVPDTGLSTTNLTLAQQHKDNYGFDFQEISVEGKTLTQICEEHRVSDIHFLKIDVEGSEAKVIDGLDLTRIRPWILIIESTEPLTPTENYKAWEPCLIDNQYEFVYFDGLNRFYVAIEHSELIDSFQCPPNIWDDFQPASHAQLIQKHQNLTQETEDLKTKNESLEEEYARLGTNHNELTEKYQELQTRYCQLKEDIEASKVRAREARLEFLESECLRLGTSLNLINSSRSMRYTAPFRALGRFLKRGKHALVQGTWTLLKKPSIKVLIRQVLATAKRIPFLRKLTLKIFAKFPRLQVFLSLVKEKVESSSNTVLSESKLSKRTLMILDDLQNALDIDS